MGQLSLTARIMVTIVRRQRRHHSVHVTTAPVELDRKMVTRHEGRFSDVVALTADLVTYDELRARTPARLALIEVHERAWQRATYRGHQQT
jgi:hypothetical protein